ncbi:MAG: NrtA/SsuA/CpmA family ABC transporter substrate-binding protein [Streptosporangiales bacterium]|nr:NrtA/SsuA/CpmA family ABC transporter substrate-binding protein [Streptosporangiales bacterium]
MTSRWLRTPALMAALVLALGVLVGGCGNGAVGGGSGKQKAITIAYQPGIGYAPLLVAKQKRLLEKKFPDRKFTWKVLNSGSAIRDGMLSGKIQIGAGGIGPFLVGASQGVQWRIVSSLDDANLQLMAKNPKIKTLADLKGKGQIAMPGPDSIQAVVLQKAAQEKLGNAHAFDNQIIAMGHPDGLQALASGQVAAHLTSPPFQDQEKAQGARALVGSYEVFGKTTFNSTFVMNNFAKSNGDVVSALRDATASSVQELQNDPAAAAKALAAEGSAGKDAATLQKQITASDITYTTKPTGFMTFATFMKQSGAIKKAPKSASSLFIPSDLTKGGS